MFLEDKKNLIFKQLDDSKIENIEIINVAEKTSIADYIIIGNGRSEKHIEATFEKLRTDLKNKNILPPATEGKSSNWLLLDLNDIIVHLFTEESRNLYKLEELWNKKK